MHTYIHTDRQTYIHTYIKGAAHPTASLEVANLCSSTAQHPLWGTWLPGCGGVGVSQLQLATLRTTSVWDVVWSWFSSFNQPIQVKTDEWHHRSLMIDFSMSCLLRTSHISWIWGAVAEADGWCTAFSAEWPEGPAVHSALRRTSSADRFARKSAEGRTGRAGRKTWLQEQLWETFVKEAKICIDMPKSHMWLQSYIYNVDQEIPLWWFTASFLLT